MSTSAPITRDRDGASSHTPGPWKSYGPLVYFDMDGPAHHLVADCMQSGNAAMDCANAGLIAAAPLMLETIKNLLSLIKDDFPRTADEVRKVIAKAEGRT